MDIEKVHELCFTLYRVRWLQQISMEEKMASVQKYFAENDAPGMLYDSWILIHGFDGRIYRSQQDFLRTHYKDAEYMKELITDPELWEEYKKDTGYKE